MRSSQRNTYLTGFCLFLSLVLTRTFYIILDLIHTQEEYAKLKQEVRLLTVCPSCSTVLTPRFQTAKGSRSTIAAQDQSRQIDDLKKKLADAENKVRDYGVYT